MSKISLLTALSTLLPIRIFTMDSWELLILFLLIVSEPHHVNQRHGFSRPYENMMVLTDIGAHVAFFGLLAEMEKPEDFPKAVVMLQSFEVALYVSAAVVIYWYVGNGVASPALGSAGPLLKKVAYGIAIPTVGSLSPMKYMSRMFSNIPRLSVQAL